MHLVSRGSGPPILFLHGIPTSGQLWTGVIDRMVSNFTCIAVDLPGLGRASAMRADFRDLPGLAASLESIRIRCGIEKWCVVGHDAGCAIAVHYAQQFPSRVECMALMSPSIFPDLKPFFLFEILRKRVIGELVAPLIHLIFWNFAMRAALQWNDDLRDAVSDFRSPFSGARGPWRLMSLLRWGSPTEVLALIPDILAKLRLPTLVFHGAKDPAVPEAFARRAAALVHGAKVCIVDAGHFFPMCEPGLVATGLSDFFAANRTVEIETFAVGLSAADSRVEAVSK